MPITLDRSMCCDPTIVIEREWLITNKIGGYSAGTVAGVLTRREHGLLVVRPPDAITPQLLLAKVDEEVIFDERTYYLGTNEYRDGTLNPAGFVHLEAFRLENGFPVFTYHLGGSNGIQLEKRIWMPQDQNTTCIQYRLLPTADRAEGYRYRQSGPLAHNWDHRHHTGDLEDRQHSITLNILPFASYRPYNAEISDHQQLHFQVNTYHAGGETGILPAGVAGCTVKVQNATIPYYILAIGQTSHSPIFIPTGVWYWNFLHRHEEKEAWPACDHLYLPGVIRTTLQLNTENVLSLIISSENILKLPLRQDQVQFAYTQTLEQQKHNLERVLETSRYFGDGGESIQAERLPLLPFPGAADPYDKGKEFLQLLLRACDRFVVYRERNTRSKHTYQPRYSLLELVPTLTTAYFQIGTATRDTLLALPGLSLIPERYGEAQQILREIASHFKGGLLPDWLPPPGESADENSYNNGDCALWYFYALDHYLRITRDYEFLREIYPLLKDIIQRYKYGTNNGIQVDPDDNLLYASQEGKALTWMNAHIEQHFPTQRSGKPVEINALWQHALYLMVDWTQQNEHVGHFGYYTSYYQDLLLQCQKSFRKRFWYAKGGYLYDVIDGPKGNDIALRPNQIIALSLRSSQLEEFQRQAIFEKVTNYLLTPYGLRTLSPQDTAYCGQRGESEEERQKALHQGSIWSWLIGAYSEALLALSRSCSEHSTPQDESQRKELLWRKGQRLLEPFAERLNDGLLGMCEGVFSGDYPHQPGIEVASAASTAELLRIYSLLAQMRISHPGHVLYS
jgi:glycogen debranching enzyme